MQINEKYSPSALGRLLLRIFRYCCSKFCVVYSVFVDHECYEREQTSGFVIGNEVQRNSNYETCIRNNYNVLGFGYCRLCYLRKDFSVYIKVYTNSVTHFSVSLRVLAHNEFL